MNLFKSKLVSSLVILVTIFAISSPFWLFHSAEPDDQTLTPAQARKQQELEYKRHLQQETAQRSAEQKQHNKGGATGTIDLNDLNQSAQSSKIADSAGSQDQSTGSNDTHAVNAVKSGAIQAVDDQNPQQQSASIKESSLLSGEIIIDHAALDKTNISYHARPHKGGVTSLAPEEDKESENRVKAKAAVNSNNSASIANTASGRNTSNKISRAIADNIDFELSSDPNLDQPHITDLLTQRDINVSSSRNTTSSIKDLRSQPETPKVKDNSTDQSKAQKEQSPQATAANSNDNSKTPAPSKANANESQKSQSSKEPNAITGELANASLQEQVDTLVQQQTSQDKEKYQQALNDRYEQVTWAVETIKANSKIYLPENLSANAVIVYFGIDVNPPSNNKIEVDSLTGATKIAIEPEVIYTEHGKEYKARFKYGSGVKHLAKMLNTESGSTLYEILPVEPYPSDPVLLYEHAFRQQVSKQRPELTDDQGINFAEYDTIYLSYAIWWEDLPMPVYSFLDKYDLSGKTIIPLCLSRKDGFSKTIERLRAAEPNANISNAWRIRPHELEKLEFRETLRNWLIELEHNLNEGDLE